MFLEYFTAGTRATRTGGQVGIEIETDFVTEQGEPITAQISGQLMAEAAREALPDFELKLELGRQKLEVAVRPQQTADLAIVAAREALSWLYAAAERRGAYPRFAPEIFTSEPLLWVQEERDEIWVQLDGRPALEELCRCSSVQFTVDVNPVDAVSVINKLWAARLHERDYEPNNRRFTAYIDESVARYNPMRYGGPVGFEDLDDYVEQLLVHDVVMHEGIPCRLRPDSVASLDIDLYLRSIWWHYRLRRYRDNLALEIRPFARRSDEGIEVVWQSIQETVGF